METTNEREYLAFQPEFFKNYWVIITFVLGVIVAAVNLEYRVMSAENAIVELQTQNEQIATHLASIDVSIAEINVSLKQLTK